MFFQTDHTQAAEIDLDFQSRPSEGPTRLPCEFGANPFSGSRDIWCSLIHKQKPQTDGAKKQNLPQFSACGNDFYAIRLINGIGLLMLYHSTITFVC